MVIMGKCVSFSVKTSSIFGMQYVLTLSVQDTIPTELRNAVNITQHNLQVLST
jgi:hypothetical protein